MPNSSLKPPYRKFANVKKTIPLDASVYISVAILVDDNIDSLALQQVQQLAILAEQKNMYIRTSPINEHNKNIQQLVSKKETIVPWDGFADIIGDYKTNSCAKLIAMRFQPNLSKLKPAIHAIVGHFIHVILGKNLTSPVRCLICWTNDGCESLKTKTSRTGKLGVAISVASWINIPIFNLRNKDAFDRAQKYLELYSMPFTEGEWHPDLVAFNRLTEV